MAKTLRLMIGLLLLLTTVSLATCQSMVNVLPFGETSASKKT